MTYRLRLLACANSYKFDLLISSLCCESSTCLRTFNKGFFFAQIKKG